MIPDRLILRETNSPFVTPYHDTNLNGVLSRKQLDGNFIFLKGETIYDSESTASGVILKKLGGGEVVVDFTNYTGNTGSNQDNKFRYYDIGNFMLGGRGVDASDPNGLFDTAIENYLANNLSLTVNDDELIVVLVSAIVYGTFYQIERKYLFPNLLGKGTYNAGDFTLDDLELIYEKSEYNIPIENDVNVVIYPLNSDMEISGITSNCDDFYTIINTTGPYYVGDANTNYFFRFLCHGVTYIYFYDPITGGLDPNNIGTGYPATNNFDYTLFYNSSLDTPEGLNDSQLEKIIEDGNVGWRILGRNPANYATIGQDAIDFSISDLTGTTNGASGTYSFATGYQTIANGTASYAQGIRSESTSVASHAEGFETQASGDYSHAEGNGTFAIGNQSHAEGLGTSAIGDTSHSEGDGSAALGYASHAEGNSTTTFNDYSHSEGSQTLAFGVASHAEGSLTQASGHSSHAEGRQTISVGDYSHAGGQESKSYGDNSFVHGYQSIASGSSTIVLGSNITGTTSGTTYVSNLNINIEPVLDSNLTKVLSRDSDGYIREIEIDTIFSGTYATNGSIGFGSNENTLITSSKLLWDDTNSQIELNGNLVSLKFKENLNNRFFTIGNAGLASGSMVIKNQLAQSLLTLQNPINTNQAAQLAIGDVASIPNESQLYVYGGNNGANIDMRGKITRDECNMDFEGADWETNPNSLGFSYYGASFSSTTATTIGYPKQKMGIIRWVEADKAVIISNNTTGMTPIMLGINDIEIGQVNDNGFEYKSDFSNENINNPRWLTDKDYVDSKTLSNVVIVKNLNDFPTPIGNVITLSANTAYNINGSINIGENRINLSTSNLIYGIDKSDDKLIYTGTSAMITGSNTDFSIEHVTLAATTTGGSIFNISGSTNKLEINNNIFAGNKSLGTIVVGDLTIIRDNLISSNVEGLTINGNNSTSDFVFGDNYIADDNTGTFKALNISGGSFNQILISRNSFRVTSGQTAINYDAITLTNGNLSNNSFNGSGTFLSGLTNVTTNWVFVGNQGIGNKRRELFVSPSDMNGVALTSPTTAAALGSVLSNTGARFLTFRGGGGQDDGAAFTIQIPSDYFGNPIFDFNFTTDTTANNVKLFMAISKIPVGGDFSTLGETGLNFVTAGVTQYLRKETSITPITTTFAGGDVIIVKVWRDPDDAADTATGINLYLSNVHFRYDSV